MGKENSNLEEYCKPSPEELKKIGQDLHKFSRLSRSMDEDFDAIFEMAPPKALYAVGILEMVNGKERPRIHYFERKHTKKNIFNPIINIFRTSNPKGALDFMIERQEQGQTISNIIYRHEDEIGYMLYAA